MDPAPAPQAAGSPVGTLDERELIRIFACLPAAERFAAAPLVCRAWRKATAAPGAWESLDLRGSARPAEWLARYRERCLPPCRWTGINAEFCALRDGDLAALPDSLLVLNLNGSREVGDASADHLSRSCPSLERIELYWNTRLTSVGIAHIARRCQRLCHLSLSGCKGADGAALQALADDGSGLLTFLDLTRCPNLTDQSMAAVVRANPGLTTLKFYATGPAVTDLVCAAIGESLKGLEFLDLIGASGITDAGVLAIVQGGCGATLTSLNLSWATKLTDVSLGAIATFEKLGFLSVFGNQRLSDTGLRRLSEGGCGDSLRYLDVNGCCNISCFRDRVALQSMFPRVHTWVVHS